MSAIRPPITRVAIACGGTGGHLFPGLAVGRRLTQCGCEVTLFISPKDIDQEAAKTAAGMRIVVLPAIGLQRGRGLAFMRGFLKSYLAAGRLFRLEPPSAALAMGGFTSAPPVVAAWRRGARTFLHESNTIPGRANRYLARVVDVAFVGFPSAARRLRCRKVTVTGTPVRAEFRLQDPSSCRVAVGLNPARPTVLVMGGSQGAAGINQLIMGTLPLVAAATPDWQWLHLAGLPDLDRVRQAYARTSLSAVVVPFLQEMDRALGAATVAVSRAGASSLAELAAMRVPAVLIPYPAAADDHQSHNALAFQQTGAARLLPQKDANPQILAAMLHNLVEDCAARGGMQQALAQWHSPDAADQIAERILTELSGGLSAEFRATSTSPGRGWPGKENRPSGRESGLEVNAAA